MSSSSTINTPPACITGAEWPLTTLSDYFRVTFPDGFRLEKVKELFGAHGWTMLPRGMLGYSCACQRGHVKILWGGSPGMGIHVELSGKGCRELEALRVVTDWPAFIGMLLATGCHFTRIDVAFDDKQGLIPMDEVGRAHLEGLYSGRIRSSALDDHRRRGVPEGQGYMFGGAGSRIRIAIYNKALQQGLEGVTWTRVELRVYDERAQALAAAIASQGLDCARGVIASSLRFVVPDCSRNRRCDTASWWAAFLVGVSKLRLTVAQVASSLDERREWLRRQAAQSLALITIKEGGSIDWIIELIREGSERLRPWQLAMAGIT